MNPEKKKGSGENNEGYFGEQRVIKWDLYS